MSDDPLERAAAIAADLVAAVHDARSLLKDLKAATVEARDVIGSVRALTAPDVSNRIDAAVKAGLDEYGATLNESIERATAAVYKRFDTLADILLGEDRKSAAQGTPPLRDLARRRA